MKRWIGFLLPWFVIAQSFAYQTFQENGKIGMKDDAGHVVLPPDFEALGWSDGNFSVIGEVTGYRLKGLWGIIDLKKKFITQADYQSLVYSGGDCIVARKKINPAFSKVGCINLKGETKIPFAFDGISVQGLRAIVFNLVGAHYYFGLTDLNNQILIPVTYKNISPLGTLRFSVENNENKIALFGEDGKSITDFSIDSVSTFYKNFALVYKNLLVGLIDRDGTLKLEMKYSAIKISEEGKVYAQLPDEWSFISRKNEPLKKILADSSKSLDRNRFIIKRGNVYGVVDQSFNEVIPIQFEKLSEIEKGKYLATQNGKIGVITENKNAVVPFSFDSLFVENKTYRAYNKKFGWQLLSSTGKELTGKYYEKLSPLNDLGFPAVSNGFAGMITTEGVEFIHCVFDSIAEPSHGLLAVKFKNNYGIIDAKEDWLVAPQTFPLRVINQQLYLQREENNNFIKSYGGDILYFSSNPFKFGNENFIEFLPNGREKILNYNGVEQEGASLPANIDHIYQESEGFRGMKKDGRFGFIDQQGRLRIANRYDSIGSFHEGLAAFKLIGKWGFITTSDQIGINPNYDQSSYFKNGVAIVSRNRKFGLIGKKGESILPMRYDKILRLPDHRFILISSGLQGVADEEGNVLVEPRFDVLQPVGKELLIVRNRGKYGVIDDHGLNMIPMIYDQLEWEPEQSLFLAKKNSEWKEIK